MVCELFPAHAPVRGWLTSPHGEHCVEQQYPFIGPFFQIAVAGNFYACPILSDHRQWTFWQYSDKGSLSGYTGYAPNIDLNVYRGSYDEFMAQFGY